LDRLAVGVRLVVDVDRALFLDKARLNDVVLAQRRLAHLGQRLVDVLDRVLHLENLLTMVGRRGTGGACCAAGGSCPFDCAGPAGGWTTAWYCCWSSASCSSPRRDHHWPMRWTHGVWARISPQMASSTATRTMGATK